MEIRGLLPSALVATALILSGCGGSTEVAPGVDVDISDETVTITGEDGTATLDSDGDSLTITGGEGEEEFSVTTGGAAEVPPSFPSDFPLPDKATLTSAVSESQGTTGLIMEWPGMTADSLKDYLDTVQAAGYTQDGDIYEMDMGDGDFTAGGQFTGPSHTVGIVGTSSDGVSQLSITALAKE
jgi:hypothetical protein